MAWFSFVIGMTYKPFMTAALAAFSTATMTSMTTTTRKASIPLAFDVAPGGAMAYKAADKTRDSIERFLANAKVRAMRFLRRCGKSESDLLLYELRTLEMEC